MSHVAIRIGSRAPRMIAALVGARFAKMPKAVTSDALDAPQKIHSCRIRKQKQYFIGFLKPTPRMKQDEIERRINRIRSQANFPYTYCAKRLGNF